MNSDDASGDDCNQDILLLFFFICTISITKNLPDLRISTSIIEDVGSFNLNVILNDIKNQLSNVDIYAKIIIYNHHSVQFPYQHL